jgi:hypothetical protein
MSSCSVDDVLHVHPTGNPKVKSLLFQLNTWKIIKDDGNGNVKGNGGKSSRICFGPSANDFR